MHRLSDAAHGGERSATAKGADGESFAAASQRALADKRLRANLARATCVIRARRGEAVGELSDWEDRRARAAGIRARAIASLGSLLEQLEAEVTAAGGVVHWAADGEQACRIVVELARAHGVRELVKVKSMTTEEIALNDALAAAGIQAIETDLAELIIQLAGDRPSHILVPAVHYGRAEIRELFARTIARGRELSDDPRALCDAARDHLRERLLAARFAVSGANFAVAQTGAVSVVESEGNGRFCVTVPEVLVSVMGIEKVIGSFGELGEMLEVLARSATGERMNPYTSIWSGVSAGDGPSEFHLVLLDGGRSRMLAGEIGRQTLRCIRCSACLNVCPVYSRTGGHAYGSVYPGPIGAILSPQLFGTGRAGSLPWASTLCGACYEVCPVKIDIPSILVALRGRVVTAGGRPLGERAAMALAARVLASRRRYAAAQRLAAPLLAVAGRLPVGPLAAWRRGGRALPRLPPSAALRARAGARRTLLPRSGAREREREDVLGRVHAALAAAGAPPSPPAKPHPSPPPAAAPPAAAADPDPVQMFCRRVGEYGAGVHHAHPETLPATLAELLVALGVRRAVLAPGLAGVLTDANGREAPLQGIELSWDHPQLPVRELGAFDAALTAAALAAAPSGTLVLDGSERCGRRALSLVCDLHVCLLWAQDILPSLPDAFAALERRGRQRAPLTLISGPSATSDIGFERVEGVHGPRRLEIVIVSGASSTGGR